MTYRSQVKNGVVTVEVPLPEGTVVNVELTEVQTEHSEESELPRTTVWEELLKFAGAVEGPEDWARNHNHYIHGTPKLP